jgi:hypothetical protein
MKTFNPNALAPDSPAKKAGFADKVGTKPVEERGGKAAPSYIKGVVIEDLITELRQDYNIAYIVDSVLVAPVNQDSFADTPLEKGDGIIQINRKLVGSVTKAVAAVMGQKGAWNVSQLVRQKFVNEAVLLGSTTYHGTMTASSDWGGLAERKRVRPALHGCFEDLFHEAGLECAMLLLQEDGRTVRTHLHLGSGRSA